MPPIFFGVGDGTERQGQPADTRRNRYDNAGGDEGSPACIEAFHTHADDIALDEGVRFCNR
jgi:hypothetical protein